ncbi:hypothetical protein T484DRAFT_1856819 [Baffinella frigidus]|nr:hypothetical protein T484DRAFT_1856819 [Cryptophyta sp. CCMP2293]
MPELSPLSNVSSMSLATGTMTELSPRSNFSSMSLALLTIFQLFTGDSWVLPNAIR